MAWTDVVYEVSGTLTITCYVVVTWGLPVHPFSHHQADSERKTQAEVTTEKYGLEAGLYQVGTSCTESVFNDSSRCMGSALQVKPFVFGTQQPYISSYLNLRRCLPSHCISNVTMPLRQQAFSQQAAVLAGRWYKHAVVSQNCTALPSCMITGHGS